MATKLETQVTATAKAYVLEGTLIEACDCGVLCPCWIGEDPDNGTCDAVTAYHIDKGEISGVDVSGLTPLEVSHVPGNIFAGKWTTVRFIDERATPEQLRAILDAFQGRLGGPLAEIAELVGQELGVYQVPIDYKLIEGAGTLTVGNKVTMTMAPFRSTYGTITTLRDSLFSSIPGSPAWVGKASEYAVNIPEHGMVWRFTGRNAIQGQFRLEA